jgi:glycosyltransferase involved in cell wall biosynthesis
VRRYALSLVSEPLEPTGIGIYGLELARAIPPLLAPEERLIVVRNARFSPPPPDERLIDAPLRFPAGRSALRRLAEQTLLPMEAARQGAVLIHTLNHVAPLFGRRPAVLTLHDTRLFESRAQAGLSRRLFRASLYPPSVRRAAGLIAISRATAERCAAIFGIDRARIAIVPHGVRIEDDRGPPGPEERAKIAERLGACGPLVVFAGAFEPNKNLLRLIDAFAEIAARPEGRRTTLVLAGPGGPEFSRIRARIAERGLAERVVFPGYLDRRDLFALLAEAAVLALPSLDEGFGMPVLEAFALGTPVLASARGGLEELAGDAALLIDPENTGAIAAGLARLLSDAALRAELSARGRARAAKFTWERTARATLEVYRAVASGCGAPSRTVEFS